MREAYYAAFGRPPADWETAAALEFLGSGDGESDEARKRAWTELCHALLASNDFLRFGWSVFSKPGSFRTDPLKALD